MADVGCTQDCGVDAVFEGGGAKGVGLVGALSALEDAGYYTINVAGTSAGAIVAALTAVGYTADELRAIMFDLDFTRFLDATPRWLPRKIRALYNLACHWGIYRGDEFLDWMRALLAAKGVRTFGDLRRGIPDRGQIYPLRVVASDVSRGRIIVLPEAIGAYADRTPDRLEVAEAVRMSMSIPYLFRPCTLRLHPTQPGTVGAPCYIVDGGLLSNFPISLFDGTGIDTRPTFGIRLTGAAHPLHRPRHAPRELIGYLLAMFATATEAVDNQYIEAHDFVRTIEVDNLGTSPTDFAMSLALKQELYQSGRAATHDFLRDWDFATWKQDYARWSHTSRRELVTASIVALRTGLGGRHARGDQ